MRKGRLRPTLSFNFCGAPEAACALARPLVDAALHLRLDRLGHVGGDASGQRAHLFGLSLQGGELLLPEGRMQFDGLGDALGANQVLGELEAGIDVPLRDVDPFAIERDGALAGRVEGLLPCLLYTSPSPRDRS